jgi:glutaredoxin 3
MGRITVFTANNCLFSTKIKHELNKRNLPFSEINLSDYPQRRSDLCLLTRRMTIPQAFFNTRYIGGCDATLQLLEEWDHDAHFQNPLEKYKAQIQRFPDPSNPQLTLPEPTYDMGETSSSESSLAALLPFENPVVQLRLSNGTTKTYGITELTRELSRVLPLASLPYHLVNYNKSVTGSQAVSALMKHFQSETREEAEAIGKQLNKMNIIHHVAYDHAFQDTEKYYYRLQCHQTPHIINSLYVVGEGDVEKWDTARAEALVESLEAMLSTLERECYSFEGRGGIRFNEGIHKKSFCKLEEHICLFQVIELGPMKPKELLAFGLNVYHIMLKFAFFKYGIPMKESTQEIFKRELKFNVGGNLYSFSEWLGSITAGSNDNAARRSFDPTSLRASNKSSIRRSSSGEGSVSPLPQWTRSRTSTRLSLKSPEHSTNADYRVYFATHFFWARATGIAHFTAANLEKELTTMALAFCAEDCNVEVDTRKGELILSNVFSCYRKDFCSSSSGAAELSDRGAAGSSFDKDLTNIVFNFVESAKKLQLQQLLHSGSKSKLKISFRADDWTVSAFGKDFLGFNPSSLEANTKRLQR